MATIAGDIEAGRGPSAPISAHPAFPAVVALWFAALLGLGSLILPTVLLERLTSVTGLADLIPAAAAPLGFTARASIALAAALAGAVLGLLLAIQVAKGQAPKPRSRFEGDARECRPISAHEELGWEGLGAAAGSGQPQKRRSLAIAEANPRSDYLIAVPLPGQNLHDEAEAEAEPEEALELGEFAEPAEIELESQNEDISMADDTGRSQDAGTMRDDRPEAKVEEFGEPGGNGLPRAFEPLADDVAEDEFDTADHAVDALPFAPPSLRRAENDVLAASEEAGDEAGPPETDFKEVEAGGIAIAPEIAHGEQEPGATRTMSLVESDPEAASDNDTDRPLDELGLVQLATRLGKAIEQRRAQRANPVRPAPHPALSACNEDFDAAAEDDAAQARAEFFGGSAVGNVDGGEPVVESESMQVAAPESTGFGDLDLDLDEEEDNDDFVASFSLPLRQQSSVTPVPTTSSVDDDEDGDEDIAAEEDYSSLLAMRNPFERKDEFVRIELPEDERNDFEATVTFPAARAEPRAFDPPPGAAEASSSASPRNPADAERELRAALETLQRMSGAA